VARYELKTKATTVSPAAFIAAVENETARKDSKTLVKMMSKITGEKPKMWGPTIIGFGLYHYKYDSGHEGDMCITGFSPRKGALSIYLSPDYPGLAGHRKKLGKHKMGKSCLYVKKLADVDMTVLETMVTDSVRHARRMYPGKGK
jgi:hypothetical protein